MPPAVSASRVARVPCESGTPEKHVTTMTMWVPTAYLAPPSRRPRVNPPQRPAGEAATPAQQHTQRPTRHDDDTTAENARRRRRSAVTHSQHILCSPSSSPRRSGPERTHTSPRVACVFASSRSACQSIPLRYDAEESLLYNRTYNVA